MPRVSVVVSTHEGRKDRVRKAVESVIAQSYKDWELIVVDDHSMDGTYSMFQTDFLEKHPISYIYRESNFGNDTKPKNEGILAAQGELVAFLDSDNTWRSDHLQALVTELDKHPELTGVYGDRWVTDDKGQVPAGIGVFSEFSPALLLQRNYIDTSDMLVRRSALLEVGGFDERYKKYIDWNLWLRMAKAGMRFKRVPLVLTYYYLHSDQKSQKVLTDGDKTGFNTPEWDPFELEIELPYLGEIREPKVGIFSLTYDRLEYTLKCFDSLYKTAGYKFTHFIVDNGSTDGTRDLLYEWKDDHRDEVSLTMNTKNKGISIASNQALDQMVGIFDIIVKVDNDCLFLTDGWLSKMVEIWKSNHMLALSPYVQGLKDNPGGAPRIGYGQIKGELLGMTKHLGGICHFVDASAYETFRWDEHDFLHGMQDLELSQYLTMNGYQLGYMENYMVEHVDGTQGQHDKYPAYFERRKTEKNTRYETSKSTKS